MKRRNGKEEKRRGVLLRSVSWVSASAVCLAILLTPACYGTELLSDTYTEPAVAESALMTAFYEAEPATAGNLARADFAEAEPATAGSLARADFAEAEPATAGSLARNASFAEEPAARALSSWNGSDSRTVKVKYDIPGVSNKSIYAYTRLTTTVNGKSISDPSLIINGIVYLPLRSAANALGITGVSYNSQARTMTVNQGGLYLTATDGGYVVYANSRPLFNFSPAVIMSNGRMYIPASTFAKATGTSFVRSGSTLVLSGSFRPLAQAASYYRDDEVLWLARIITAEAGGETLLGQIAVGDVILNRVKSGSFPNTIYSVIFDKKYGVQFTPAANGTIYNTPTYTATLAAKICLEGTSLSDNAMYFINPYKAPNSWVSKYREYAYTIGNHDFYL